MGAFSLTCAPVTVPLYFQGVKALKAKRAVRCERLRRHTRFANPCGLHVVKSSFLFGWGGLPRCRPCITASEVGFRKESKPTTKA